MKIKIFAIMFLLFFAGNAFVQAFERPTVRDRITVTEPILPTITRDRPIITETIDTIETAIQDLQSQIDAIDIHAVVTPQIKQLLAQIVALQAQIPPINQTTSFQQTQILLLKNRIDALPPQLDPYSVIVPIFSGNCSVAGTGTNANLKKFCLDRVKFNSAQNYLSVDPSGDITVLITGLYNIYTQIVLSELIYINGIPQNFLQGAVPLWAGDTLHWKVGETRDSTFYEVKITYLGAHNFPNPSIIGAVPTFTPLPGVEIPDPNPPVELEMPINGNSN